MLDLTDIDRHLDGLMERYVREQAERGLRAAAADAALKASRAYSEI